MNKKITSVALSLLFTTTLLLTSCASSKGGKKAHRCPAYGGDINTIEVPNDNVPS